MIELKIIDAQHKADINILNEPFLLFGKIIPTYSNEQLRYDLLRYDSENVTEMCFPNENYDYDAMRDSIFLGAYDGERCVGLAILQHGFF